MEKSIHAEMCPLRNVAKPNCWLLWESVKTALASMSSQILRRASVYLVDLDMHANQQLVKGGFQLEAVPEQAISMSIRNHDRKPYLSC